MRYVNRQDAGQQLGQALRHYKSKNTVVLALPRGGVVVGAEVARILLAPLGVVLVRKIGHPRNPEYAVGAIAEQEPPVYNTEEIEDINDRWLWRAEEDARKLIEERRALYYGEDLTPPAVEDRIVILVDDGIATGMTMEAAIRSIQLKKPAKVVVAVPVAPADAVDSLSELADEVVVLNKPENFLGAVGSHYQQFEQVDDEEVRELLREVRDDLY